MFPVVVTTSAWGLENPFIETAKIKKKKNKKKRIPYMSSSMELHLWEKKSF